MADRASHKGPFSVVQVSGMMRRMVEWEQEMRDNGTKPCSDMPVMMEQVRQFVVAHADEFDAFVPGPAFRRKSDV